MKILDEINKNLMSYKHSCHCCFSSVIEKKILIKILNQWLESHRPDPTKPEVEFTTESWLITKLENELKEG